MSYNIGLSGLRTTNKSLDVISQNIANVSTSGFKAARAELSALYGGGEPAGVELSKVSQNFDKDGNKTFTGRSLDMAISGKGFFVTKNNQGQTLYTRSGQFSQDADHNIVGSDGEHLQGFGVDKNGNLMTGVMSNLKVGTGNLPAKASTRLDFKANLRADAELPKTPKFDTKDPSSYNYSYTSKLYDSKGTEHTLTQYFVKSGENQWTAHAYVDGQENSTQELSFNPDGSLAAPKDGFAIDFAPEGADAMNVKLGLTGTTQYAADFSAQYTADGYSAGEMSGLHVEDDGSIMAVYTNGKELLQGKVVLANFANPEGLATADNTSWTSTFESGHAELGQAGTGTLGNLVAGAYEGSNVDLTGELVNLMTAQRNYQANAKSVSTADKMTQVLFSSM
ncbi:flagellar hook protein FlgE [Gallaecimonas mangrovi]|uniref:flagellar hook protein FlgE n=1 Tax=Gallaecimonas mangrovi TaxID=2291597 RepID=UPI000E207D43|nr:flagellar hook protein FlgE [Gallaecimonas mangrovi]